MPIYPTLLETIQGKELHPGFVMAFSTSQHRTWLMQIAQEVLVSEWKKEFLRVFFTYLNKWSSGHSIFVSILFFKAIFYISENSDCYKDRSRNSWYYFFSSLLCCMCECLTIVCPASSQNLMSGTEWRSQG